MWIKICGITSIEDAELSVAAGADAVGFVFAESPRRMTADAAQKIVQKLPPSVEKIGVFVDATIGELAETVTAVGLTGVQVHGTKAGLQGFRKGLQDFRGRLDGDRATLRVLQVVRYGKDPKLFALSLQTLRESCSDGDSILVDTCIAGKEGGTGVAFDWQAARDCFLEAAPHVQLIAAGGLRPENVREAVQTLEPWGVDVSSGVESSPGKKDPERVGAFIRAAREADSEIRK